MFNYIIKTEAARRCEAFELGADTPMEKKLLASGAIRKTEDGYELFSQEAKDGKGQPARAGDFFKCDHLPSGDFPYPIIREVFLARHQPGEDSTHWIQNAAPVGYWRVGLPIPDEVWWLLDTGRLKIHVESTKRFFRKNDGITTGEQGGALLVYEVCRNENGGIIDIDFAFITKEMLETTYEPYKED